LITYLSQILNYNFIEEVYLKSSVNQIDPPNTIIITIEMRHINNIEFNKIVKKLEKIGLIKTKKNEKD